MLIRISKNRFSFQDIKSFGKKLLKENGCVSGDVRKKLSLYRNCKFLVKNLKLLCQWFLLKNNCEHRQKAINQINRIIKLLQQEFWLMLFLL